MERHGDIMPHQFEPGIAHKMFDVPLVPREKIIDTENIMSLGDQLIAKMGAQEACAPTNQYLFHENHSLNASLPIDETAHPAPCIHGTQLITIPL
jgi:hypothetical protein